MWQPHNYYKGIFTTTGKEKGKMKSIKLTDCKPVSGSAIFLDLGLHKLCRILIKTSEVELTSRPTITKLVNQNKWSRINVKTYNY
jgi:hypothetical protein